MNARTHTYTSTCACTQTWTHRHTPTCKIILISQWRKAEVCMYMWYIAHCACISLWCLIHSLSFVNTAYNWHNTVLLWGAVFGWKYNYCIVVKPDRALRYNNQARFPDSICRTSCLPANSYHQVLTSTCSLSLTLRFNNSTAQLPSSASKNSWSSKTPVNQLVWHVIHINQLPGSALIRSKYPFTFLTISLPYRHRLPVQLH